MLRSCLASLLLWAGLGAAYYLYLEGSYEPPADWIASLVGSFLSLLGIGCLRNIVLYLGDYRKVAGSRYSFVPNDPGVLAVSGRIESREGGVTSPFTGTPCAFFGYEAYHEVSYRRSNSSARDTQRHISFSGFQLAPSEIRGPMGSVQLLGFPTLDGFSKKQVDPAVAIPKAREFISRTSFEDMSGVAVGKMISAVKDLLTDDDGKIDKNWQMVRTIELEDLDFEEELVPLGEEVCAVGYYMPERRGLVPHLRSGNIIRLYQGAPEAVLGLLRSKLLGYAVGAILLLGLCNAVLWFFLDRYQHSPSQVSERSGRLRDAVQADKLEEARQLIAYGADPDYRNSFNETPLMEVRSGAMAELLAGRSRDPDVRDGNGRTALMRAAQGGHSEAVERLIAAGAALDVRDNEGETALSLALGAQQEEAAAVLRRAGAADEMVTSANGTALTEASAPFLACREYLAAIHRGDSERMRAILRPQRPDYFETIDWQVWQDSRPRRPQLVAGFGNDERASLTIGDASGTGLRFAYQLSRRADGSWQIERERIAEP